jgi:phosphatidylglycerophosphate synthase
VIDASILGKLKTISHVVLVLVVLAARTFSLGSGGEIAKIVAMVLAIATSVISGADYFYRSRRLFT